MESASGQDTFHLFSQLPPEIRLRIWSLNLPQAARLVPIYANAPTCSFPHCNNKQSLSSPQAPQAPQAPRAPQAPPPTPPPLPGLGSTAAAVASAAGCVTTAPVPPNLHACSESRLHALQTFDLAFGFARMPGRIPLDFARDMVYFPSLPGLAASSSSFRSFLLLCTPKELSRVRRVAVHEDVLGVDDASFYHSGVAVGRTAEVITLIRTRLPHVDEVVFVSPREDRGRRLQMQVETAMRDQGEDTLRCMVVLKETAS